MPGWDEWSIETTWKFAHHGYMAICPNLFSRNGPGSPDDVATRVRAAGGVHDAQVMADIGGAIAWLRAQPASNGRVGVIGFCSGGRHTFLAACTVPGVDAAVNCWGGNVVVDDESQLTPVRPVARSITPRTSPARCSVFSATTTRTRHRPLWIGSRSS
jgi:carboxymethylenebutenolidase